MIDSEKHRKSAALLTRMSSMSTVGIGTSNACEAIRRTEGADEKRNQKVRSAFAHAAPAQIASASRKGARALPCPRWRWRRRFPRATHPGPVPRLPQKGRPEKEKAEPREGPSSNSPPRAMGATGSCRLQLRCRRRRCWRCYCWRSCRGRWLGCRCRRCRHRPKAAAVAPRLPTTASRWVRAR